uniref:Uncharacterized protein n=1 Tax=Hyaloperonospora arabidopsidis (strain Emoy2) TaxID=559515 RepID=M4BCA6_HYAAE
MTGTTAEARTAASKPVVSSSSGVISSPRSAEQDPSHPFSTCKRAIGTHIVGQQKPLLNKTRAAHVSTRRAEQDEEKEEEEKAKKKHEVGGVAELQDSSGRYQGIKQQEQVEAQELAVVEFTMESGQLELQLQLETAQKLQQRDAVTIQELSAELATTVARLAEEEERGMKWEEENKSLIEQVDALEDDKQKLEKKVKEVEGLDLVVQMKVDDLMRQLREARQEQEELKLEFCGDFLSASLNQVRRGDDDELDIRATRKSVVDRTQELQIEIGGWKAEVGASAEKWKLERQELKEQIDELTLANQEASVELAEVAQMREHLLEHVGINLTCESMESFLGAQNNTIQRLTAQLSAIKASHIYGNSIETEDYCVRLEKLQTKYDMMASKRLEQDKTIAELCAELNCKAVHNSFSHLPEHSKRWRACEPIVESEHVSRLVESTRTQELKSSDDFSATKSKIEALVLALQIDEPASSDGGIKPCHTSRLKELAKCLEQAQDLLINAAEPKQRRQDEVAILQERIHRHEIQNRLMLAKLEGCECALKAQGFAVKKPDDASDDAGRRALLTDDAGFVVTNGKIVDRSNGLSCDLERTLDATRTRLHGACKTENSQMTSEVAKKADGVLELEQDHDALLEVHQTSSSELEAMVEQLDLLKHANQALSSAIANKSDDLRYHYEAFTMQKEDFRCVITNLESAVFRAEMENGKIKRDFEDVKTENDALSERIGRLHSLANGKTESDEGLETDREVEKLRSSLVQAKVNCLEQKQQLTALEKKLVDVSKPGGFACTVSSASLDAERREFEAALIEMIEMEKKLQVAYEAKQGLESTLQERMEAKAELEDKLCAAEDKIAEMEQQLEQKVALIATIEEQLRSVEEEREKLSDEFEKTKSKLERSIGKLEEKEIESEAFKTTANMLKDERSRLFSEIALLKDDIAKSEVQKAALANSQELANEELEDQLNELADRIAEIEAEKQDLRARLEDTVNRSEEDILQLRGRLYRLEEEKSSIDDENLSLERTIEDMEVELDTLEEQKTFLEAANVLSSEQVTLLEKRLEEASTEIALVSDEKNELQVQLTQSIVEKDGLSRSVSELQEKACAEKEASKQVAAELESQTAANKILDSKIRLMKQMAEKALQSVKAKDEELSEAMSRAANLVEERDSVRVSLDEKESAVEASLVQSERLQQQVEKLTKDLESCRIELLEEASASEVQISNLTSAEAELSESLESVRKDLAGAESCILILVEERDEARKELSAKDLKIEMMKTAQGEFELSVQKLENELGALRRISSTEAEKRDRIISDLEMSKDHAEKRAHELQDALLRTEESHQSLREQLTESEWRIGALETERDATRSSLDEKESTHETLSALQEDLQKSVCALESELKGLRESSSAELAAANETIESLKTAETKGAEVLASLRLELAEAEACVMVLVDERDATKKVLSKRELTLEVLSCEHGELQLKSQSVKTELDVLRQKSEANARAAEEAVQTLKEALERTTGSLELAQKELAASELRVASLSAECEAVSTTMSGIDTERNSLSLRTRELEHHIKTLETKIMNLETRHAEALRTSEEMNCALKLSEAEAKKLLESVQIELCNSKSHSKILADECDSLNNTLTQKEKEVRSFITQTERLQERIESLQSELQEVRSQRESDVSTAEEKIRSLKESEAQLAETLEVTRQKLSETDARAVCAEEEHEAARQSLSSLEAQREAEREELKSFQERIESLQSELQEVRSQRESDVSTAEEKIRSLKESEAQLAETLEVTRQKLSETDARAVCAEEEHEAARQSLSSLEAQREAEREELKSFQERIESLQSELQEVRSQRESDVSTAEEKIRSLKESEAQLAETLEMTRRKLSETDARAVCAEEEHEAARQSLSSLEAQREAEREELKSFQERIESLQSELQEVRSQRESDVSRQRRSPINAPVEREWAQVEAQLRDEVGMVEARSAKEIGLLKKKMASLSESFSSALAEASSVRERWIIEDEKHVATIARKDEVISTLKKKLEEVMAAYKRVKGRLQELQDTLTQSTKLNDSLKVSNDELNAQRSKSLMELDALKCELTLFCEQSVTEGDKLRQAGESFAASEAQLVAQLDVYKKRVLAYDDELAQMRRQHDVALHEQKETLLVVSAANLKVVELQESLAVLTETAERKEAEIHSMAERTRHIEQEQAKTVSVCEEMDRKREAERVELEAQLSMANETIATLRSASIANVSLQNEFVSQLEYQIGKLQQKVEAEKEEADAARAALGTYRKRAHTALKKASSENRLNLDKSAEIITKLEKEAGTAKDRIRVLETELAEARRRIEEVVSAEDAGAEEAFEALKAEKHVQETSLRLEIDSLKEEVMRLEEVLENVKAPLKSQIKQLIERNEALDHEIVSLKEEARIKNKSVEREVLAKEDEISDLSKQLHAALAAAASLATNEAGRHSYSPTYSPTDKERRSTASSSRSFEYDGNNNSLYRAVIEEEHELIAAAFDDSCASKIAIANRAEQQLEISVDVDGEVMRLELLLKDVQARSHVFERKYEEAVALLNEANQEKQRLQELDDRATQEINIEVCDPSDDEESLTPLNPFTA